MKSFDVANRAAKRSAYHRWAGFLNIFMEKVDLGHGSNPAYGDAKRISASHPAAEVFALPLRVVPVRRSRLTALS